MSAEPEQSTAERHASWPELFFDLVAVAGVSVVAGQLEAEQSWQHIAVLAIAFAAFWILWASVTTYGNLLADSTSMLVLFASMAVLGVMAASVPEIYGEHARTFAVAYVIGRLLIARPWRRGAVVVDLPIVQASFGILPWIVSIWVEGDARYLWWGIGIALDLLTLLTNSGEKMVGEAQRRLDRLVDRQSQHADRHGPGGRRGRELPATVTALRGDREHLAERMGLFVLIILGEAIIQLTIAANASEDWSRELFFASIGAFTFICLVFIVAVMRGTAGLALLPAGVLPPRGLWLGHLIVAMALVTTSSALGRVVEEPHESIDQHTAAMLAVGTASFGIISGLAHLASRAPRSRALAAAVAGPIVVAAAVVAFAYSALNAGAMGWILAAGVLAVLALGRLAEGRRAAPDQT